MSKPRYSCMSTREVLSEIKSDDKKALDLATKVWKGLLNAYNCILNGDSFETYEVPSAHLWRRLTDSA